MRAGDKRLIVDFDDTLVNSVKAYCEVYGWVFGAHSLYKPANWEDVYQWDMKDECPLAVPFVKQMFEHSMFFDKLEFFPNALEVLEKLSEKYDVSICTIGTQLNIARKSDWIAQNIPFVNHVIYLSNGTNKPDKSMIDMRGAMFIDDCAGNLFSSSSPRPICYGKVREANKDWNGERVLSWKDVESLLLT